MAEPLEKHLDWNNKVSGIAGRNKNTAQPAENIASHLPPPNDTKAAIQSLRKILLEIKGQILPDRLINFAKSWENKFKYLDGGSKYPEGYKIGTCEVQYAIMMDKIAEGSSLDCSTFVAFVLYNVDKELLRSVVTVTPCHTKVGNDVLESEYYHADTSVIKSQIEKNGGKFDVNKIPKRGDFALWEHQEGARGHIELVIDYDEKTGQVTSIGATGGTGDSTPKIKTEHAPLPWRNIHKQTPFLGFWTPYSGFK